MAVPGADGSLTVGLLVETWSQRQNRLHHTLIGAAGDVLFVELRTSTDSYRIFPVSPAVSGQTLVAGPGAGNAQSPAGWLFAGAQNSINIAGNNANAYLDAATNNRPDRGGTTVVTGDFVTPADLTVSPSTNGNREVAVQNLFYLNNRTHDILYQHGFTESAGNFQEDNFGAAGAGSDSVNAEAQDGSGTDNANFSTPPDGRNPRMQMFLWTGAGPDHEVFVHAPASLAGSYGAAGAAFGRALTDTGIRGAVVVVDDGVGVTSDGCEGAQAAVKSKIALVDRGACNFTVKVLNAQHAGAIAVIVANNQGGTTLVVMGGDEKRIRISSVMISQNDGAAFKASTEVVDATLRKHPNPPLQIDSALDSDVVYHEYGHGLTWRMIGGMSGPLSGAVGEGASDTVSMLINDDDRIGEYSASNPLGIRRNPYAGYPRTYGDVTGEEVHDDGEVFGAIGWRLMALFSANAISTDVLFGYFVDGMNFTAAGPAFEDMRDGMLQSAANAGGAHTCLIWQGFTEFGVGVGASGTVTSTPTGSQVTVVESFVMPDSCSP